MTSTAVDTLRTTAQPSTAANTAPVHEFRCLYTYDLRRKQKRWQDGFLKFHTFNRRVMVYDQPRNYIGDTHWKDGDNLHDGDELTLENGVIVQVAEPVATTQTDLTPLFEKKPKDTPERPGHEKVRLPQRRLPTPGVRSTRLAASVAPRHKPLSQLLGTPNGPHGRALLPTRSPFEERQTNLQGGDEWAASERAAKRRRVAEAEQTWSIARETRAPVPQPHETPTIGRQRMAQVTPLSRKTPVAMAGELIDLVSDGEDVEPQSDITLPNTPPDFDKFRVRSRKIQTPAPTKIIESPQPLSSPPVSTTNRVVHVQEETGMLDKAIDDAEEAWAEKDPIPKRSKKLRLATGARPKMLLCQDVAPAKKGAKIFRAGASEIPHKEDSAQPGRALESDDHVAGKARRQSEIRKLQNGLTQSSPQEQPRMPHDVFPQPDEDNPEYRRSEPSYASKTIITTDPHRKGSTEESGKDPSGIAPPPRPEVKANRPNLHIQPTVLQNKQTSPREFRRIRSENDGAAGQKAALSRSSDESKLLAEDEPRNIVRGQDATRHLQRSASLNLSTLRQPEREKTPPSPVVDMDIGPWSTEAMDLFDWKPPGYVFRGQGKGFGPAESSNAGNVAAT